MVGWWRCVLKGGLGVIWSCVRCEGEQGEVFDGGGRYEEEYRW